MVAAAAPLTATATAATAAATGAAATMTAPMAAAAAAVVVEMALAAGTVVAAGSTALTHRDHGHTRSSASWKRAGGPPLGAGALCSTQMTAQWTGLRRRSRRQRSFPLQLLVQQLQDADARSQIHDLRRQSLLRGGSALRRGELSDRVEGRAARESHPELQRPATPAGRLRHRVRLRLHLRRQARPVLLLSVQPPHLLRQAALLRLLRRRNQHLRHRLRGRLLRAVPRSPNQRRAPATGRPAVASETRRCHRRPRGSDKRARVRRRLRTLLAAPSCTLNSGRTYTPRSVRGCCQWRML